MRLISASSSTSNTEIAAMRSSHHSPEQRARAATSIAFASNCWRYGEGPVNGERFGVNDAATALLHLYAGRLHARGILLEFPAHIIVELLRRHGHRLNAELRQLVLHGGIFERLGDLPIQPFA